MQTTNPEIANKVSESFQNQKFMNYIGAKLTKVDPGFVEIELPFHQDLTQQHGFFHGGIVATLADNASGFAGFSTMKSDEQPLSVEFKINLMAKAQGELLIARGKVLKNGRRIKVCQSDVYCIQNGEEIHCAIALVSVYATKEALPK